ncbi:hypothetical protein B0T25DRAFT_609822 [Lasiosphaeria hispida]|uniref:Fungal N-terminal domain-containing protein n=1 Tax=Lasiosphaeria hispida TaxID=260671 RepID=A0AAJ0MC30_9PEZI|nr:hypothetical protein B0T25DRAFT_609822 [Lasiosphaeria hispida]
MDPTSIIGLAASIAGVVTLGQKVAAGLVKTYSAARDAPEELGKISNDIYALCGFFDQMKVISDEPHQKRFRFKTDSPLATAIQNCTDIFREIEAAVKSVEAGGEVPTGTLKGTLALRFRWPLRKSRLREMLVDLEKTKTTLLLGLQITCMIERRAIPGEEAAPADETVRKDEASEAAIIRLYEKQNEETTNRQGITQHQLRGLSQQNTEKRDGDCRKGKEKESHLGVWTMTARSGAAGELLHRVTSMGLSQPDIRCILAEQATHGNTSALLGLRKLNPEQRLVVTDHNATVSVELVMVTVWEARQLSTAFDLPDKEKNNSALVQRLIAEWVEVDGGEDMDGDDGGSGDAKRRKG